MSEFALRKVYEDDLLVFFEQQLDPSANWMAAFTAKDPADHTAFAAHWARILADPTITIRTVLHHGDVAGNVLRFDHQGKPEVSYWLGREHWGKGLATKALSTFLDEIDVRPVYARAAKDNVASLRVLEKCGFVRMGEDSGFSPVRGTEVEEFVLVLP